MATQTIQSWPAKTKTRTKKEQPQNLTPPGAKAQESSQDTKKDSLCHTALCQQSQATALQETFLQEAHTEMETTDASKVCGDENAIFPV